MLELFGFEEEESFEENAEATISGWRNKSKEDAEFRTPWSSLRECGNQFYPIIIVMNLYIK